MWLYLASRGTMQAEREQTNVLQELAGFFEER
jgi:hypothetical protein